MSDDPPDPRSWITLPSDRQTPEVARATKPWQSQGRRTPAVIAVMKASPATLSAVNRMNGAVTFGGSVLGQRREELLATLTSAVNECFY